jgi:hypothetical protein
MRALAMSSPGRKHRGADRVDRFDRRTDQALDQVDVVDHQVEHDVDVGAAFLERRQAMRLDELRRAQRARQREDRRVEALEVAHLQHAPGPGGKRDQLRASSSVVVIGFSTSTWMPCSRHSLGDRVMQRRGRGDADGIDLAEQFAIVRDCPATRLAGNFLRAFSALASTTATSLESGNTAYFCA